MATMPPTAERFRSIAFGSDGLSRGPCGGGRDGSSHWNAIGPRDSCEGRIEGSLGKKMVTPAARREPAAHRSYVRHTRECSVRSGRVSGRPYPDRRRRARRQSAGAYGAMPQDLHRKVRWVADSSTLCHSRRNFPRQPSEGAVGVLGCLGARGANPMPPAMRHGLSCRA